MSCERHRHDDDGDIRRGEAVRGRRHESDHLPRNAGLHAPGRCPTAGERSGVPGEKGIHRKESGSCVPLSRPLARPEPDGIATGMTRELGWEKNLAPENPRRYVFPATPLAQFAKDMQTKLNA